MKTVFRILLVPALFLAAITSTPAAGQYHEISYPPSTQVGELQLGVTYTVWIPDGVTRLRGIIVHQHGCGSGACKGGETAAYDLHWQALAKKWDCALLGPSYHQDDKQNCRLWCDPRNGSAKAFLKALGDLAAKSKHPELESVPWCLWGHSGGGFWASLMQTAYPDRIVAIWLRSGTAYATWEKGDITKPEVPEAAFAIPVMCNPGAKEKGDKRFDGAWTGSLAMFQAYRAKGAPIGFAPDPRTSHECGDSRYLAIPFFDACLARRLPDKDSKEQKLKSVDLKAGWLAPLLGDKAEAGAKYTGKVEEAVWLPSESVAKAWEEYVKSGAVGDTTPPPAPFGVKVAVQADKSVEITWDAEADFESGLRAFIIQRDGKDIGQVPEKPVGRYGRPLFQAMSYHDTPEKPLPVMRYVDREARPGMKHEYRVSAVNGVGLRSAPSALAARKVDAMAGKRVVVLGDSITQSGGYVTFLTYYLEKLHPEQDFNILGLGLASETLSGLSEAGHAGGKFPRPCLFERLGRLLDRAKPEVVLACYGMNDGIYQPLDEARFTAFKKGVTKLVEQCQQAGVKQVYLITPPIFDFKPRGDEFNYDSVLTTYAKWEGELKIPGVDLIDLHTAMRKAREARSDPFSKDHVHPGDDGHLLMARTILAALAVKAPDEGLADIKKDPMYQLVAEKRALRSAQWMKHIGYTREATVAPQPLGTVEADAARIQEKIDTLRRASRWQTLERTLTEYRQQLNAVRKEHGGVRSMPAVPFFLFGMGERQKLLYRKGELRDARTDKVIRRWEVADELIVPSAYTVALKTMDGRLAFLSEDEEAVWLEEQGARVALSKGKVVLPEFAGYRHPAVLKVLHQELLVNVVDGKPLPNFFVYSRPWYRDSAMMAMAFQKTGNLHLIKDWILGLREPFDRNNNGETEADNLGQALYLVSLVADKSHPLVAAVQKELKRFEKGKHIEGRSDFALHPVYQTKWLKFGLAALGLEDPYEVPKVADSYAPLFWWHFKDRDQAGQKLTESGDYPYLTWAGAHYTGQKQGKLSDQDYPLTWEAKASQADYSGMRRVDTAFEKERLCAPHTWHAAEAFLFLLDEKAIPNQADQLKKLGARIQVDDQNRIVGVHLGERRVTDADLLHLQGLEHLQELDLTRTKITSAGLVHLKDLTSLQKLFLTETRVDDAGISNLKGMKKLATLGLSGTKVSDQTLAELQALRELRLLFCIGTAVTEAGVKKLQQALPQCRVGH